MEDPEGGAAGPVVDTLGLLWDWPALWSPAWWPQSAFHISSCRLLGWKERPACYLEWGGQERPLLQPFKPDLLTSHQLPTSSGLKTSVYVAGNPVAGAWLTPGLPAVDWGSMPWGPA